jgi:hypothetical protein
MNYKPDGERNLKTVRFLYDRKEEGATWFELGGQFGWHHGQSSAALSTLHKQDRISRLKEKRGKSSVYVDKMYVGDRETVSYGANRKQDTMSANDALAKALWQMEQVRRGVRSSRILSHNKQCWRDHPDCALKVAMAQVAALRQNEYLEGFDGM